MIKNTTRTHFLFSVFLTIAIISSFCPSFAIWEGLEALRARFGVSAHDLPDLKQAEDIKNIVPVLVLGSGPAGLSGAMYTARAKIPTILLTGPVPGGQLTDVRKIENWPGREGTSGTETIEDLREQAEHFGVRILNDSAKKVDLSTWPFTVITETGLKLRPLTLIVATGRLAKRLHVPGIEEYWGKGIGTCTICDAPFHKGETVAVVGGGDTAGDRAQQLAAYAKKVYMFVKDPQLDASGTVQDYIKSRKNIEVLLNTEVKSVDGDGNKLTNATLYNLKTGKTEKKPITGLYFAIGYHPNSDVVKGQIQTDKEGFIKLTGRTHQTSVPGVFAGGDIVDKRYGKAGVATGSGIKASLDAINFLQDIGFTSSAVKSIEPNFFKPINKLKQELPQAKTIAELEAIIAKEPLVLVDIYATYCPSCKNLIPILKEIAGEYENELSVIKVDQGQSPNIIKKYQIASVPYLLLFKNGKLIEKTKSIRSKADIKKLIEKYLED